VGWSDRGLIRGCGRRWDGAKAMHLEVGDGFPGEARGWIGEEEAAVLWCGDGEASRRTHLPCFSPLRCRASPAAASSSSSSSSSYPLLLLLFFFFFFLSSSPSSSSSSSFLLLLLLHFFLVLSSTT
jgi:hypothetical protein